MGGLSLVLELLSQTGSHSSSSNLLTLHSVGSLCALSAATSAASLYGLLPPRIPDSFTRQFLAPTAFCEEARHKRIGKGDLKAERYENGVSYRKGLFEKEYTVTLKPIFSAFRPGTLTLTITRALLLNFQPVVEAYMLRLKPEEEDDSEEEEPAPIEYKTALRGSGWTALREVTVVTTRRLLERIALRNVSKRIAWKLLKDLQRSAERKAMRFDSKLELFIAVEKTTFRGHSVAIAASWLVQLIVDIYNCIRSLYLRKRKVEENQENCYQIEIEELTILWRRIVGNTLKCCSSLAGASVGAGAGAVMIKPALGQWIGCMVGETAGAIGMGLLIDPWVAFGSFSSLDVD